MKKLYQYINAQVLNGYITEAEKKFLYAHKEILKAEATTLNKGALMADLRNDNKNYIINFVLKPLMQATNTTAII